MTTLLAGTYDGTWTKEKWARYKSWANLCNDMALRVRYRYQGNYAECMD